MGLWRYKNGRREKATHSIFIKLNFETQILLAFHHPKFNPPEKGLIPRPCSGIEFSRRLIVCTTRTTLNDL